MGAKNALKDEEKRSQAYRELDAQNNVLRLQSNMVGNTPNR